MAQRPLRKHTCERCSRNFFSRSNLSRFCSTQCQVATWRKNNNATHEELEEKFTVQEQANNNQQGAA